MQESGHCIASLGRRPLSPKVDEVRESLPEAVGLETWKLSRWALGRAAGLAFLPEEADLHLVGAWRAPATEQMVVSERMCRARGEGMVGGVRNCSVEGGRARREQQKMKLGVRSGWGWHGKELGLSPEAVGAYREVFHMGQFDQVCILFCGEVTLETRVSLGCEDQLVTWTMKVEAGGEKYWDGVIIRTRWLIECAEWIKSQEWCLDFWFGPLVPSVKMQETDNAVHLGYHDHLTFVLLLNLSTSSKSLFPTPACDDHCVLKIPSLVCVTASLSPWHLLPLVAYLWVFPPPWWWGSMRCAHLRVISGSASSQPLCTYLWEVVILIQNFKSSSVRRFSFS